jgi:Carboxypeptidase regulatory-like domain
MGNRSTAAICSKLFFVFLVCALMLAISPASRAQATGSFSGNVLDKSGSSIAGATVTATSQGTGVARNSQTDEAGHYLIPLLPVGIYTLRVEFTGFAAAESKDLRLQVDEARELDFTLSPSSQGTTVEVNASAVAVETTSPSLGQVITSQEVAQLPLNGRDFVQLATLTSGATAETNPNSFFNSNSAASEVAARGSFSLSVGGSRPNSTDWLLDGVDNNELTAGGIGTFSSIDDIEEFKVLTYNYSAQYGSRAGPTVLVNTKNGTNDFHGSLFEFFRNTALDAKSFFATTAEKFNLNQFGGSIGGPIQKNKTFFFLDGEQKDQLHALTFTGLVPTAAMHTSVAQPYADFSADAFGNQLPPLTNPYTGTPFQCVGSFNGPPTATNPSSGSQATGVACAKVPAALVNPLGAAFINLFPLPNTNNSGSAINFTNEPVRSLNETKFDIRLDHTFSSADNVFSRFSYDNAVSYVPGGGGPGSFAEQSAFGSNQGFQNHARNIAIGETHVFSPTTVNQASFGYNRIFDYITSQGTGTCASANLAGIGIPFANLGCSGTPGSEKCTPGAYSCGLVSVLITNGDWSLGDRGYTPFQGGTDIFSFTDSLDLIRGKHDIHVGVDLRANQMNVGTEAFQDGFWIPLGFFSGNQIADLTLGYTNISEHDQTFNGPVTGRRWKIVRPFVQDDWRITKDLTLNIGLAYNLSTPISESAGRQADYIPPTTATGANAVTGELLITNQNGVGNSAGVHMDWQDLEPRVGAAYKVLGSDKTVIRGGFSIYHDSVWSQGAQGLWQNPPFFAEGDIPQFGGCPVATPSGGTPACGPGGTVTSISDGFINFGKTPPTLSTFTGTLFYQPQNFRHGQVAQYNANVEHQLPGNIVLTVGYAGSKGSHILEAGNAIDTNGPSGCVGGAYTLGCAAGGAPFISPYTPPHGNAILEFGDLGKTSYNSLQIKAETKSTRHGLYALVAYTYSNTYDNGLSDGLGSELSAPYFPLPNWASLDWAPSQIDLKHNFTASVIYDLPFGKGKQFGNNWNNLTDSLLGGWQLTLIEKITSGFAFPLVDSIDNSGVGGGNGFNTGGNGNNFNRPDKISNPYKAGVVAANPNPQCQLLIGQSALVGGVTVNGIAPASLGTPGDVFNPCAFAPATPGELGNASRVPVFGPDFVNTDFSVIKQFKLPWENMGLNFRTEFFNLFNHAQFGQPGSNVSAGGFGAVSSTVNNPRLIQFALKLTF